MLNEAKYLFCCCICSMVFIAFPLEGIDVKTNKTPLPRYWTSAIKEYIKITNSNCNVSISVYSNRKEIITIISVYNSNTLKKIIYLSGELGELLTYINEKEIKDEIYNDTSCIMYKKNRYVFIDCFDYINKTPDPEPPENSKN